MKNLLKLADLSIEEIYQILESAKQFKTKQDSTTFENKIVANLFFEPSTRTQYSFQVAQEKLGLKMISFNPEGSSLAKGETFYDTVLTFASFGVDALVIRHVENNYYNQLSNIGVPIINAGDGTGNHPSQSLLDLYTIYEEFGTFQDLKIAIIGDIKHSRVAHSNLDVMKRLGMQVFISGPEIFKEEQYTYMPFEQAILEMDILMLLRVQTERHTQKVSYTNETYFLEYGLNVDRVKQMKDHAIIMHPAPFNREVEIASDVVECSKSRILKQIENGVYVRQAILKRSLEK